MENWRMLRMKRIKFLNSFLPEFCDAERDNKEGGGLE
jgi:hypothetical protein